MNPSADTTAMLPRPARRRTAIVQASFHGLAMALMVVQGLVLVPLYLAHIDGATYGAWLATGNVLAWLGLVDPGSQAVVQQRIAAAYGRGDRECVRRVIGSGLVISGALAIAIAIVACVVAPLVPELVRAAEPARRDLIAAFVIAGLSEAMFQAALAFGTVFLGLMSHTTQIGISYVMATLTGIGVNLALLSRGVGLLSIPIGLAVRAAVLLLWNSGLFVLVIVRRLNLRPTLSRAEIAGTLRLSTFTWVARFGGTVLANVDGILVARALGPAQVTMLTVNRRVADLIGNGAPRLTAALAPGLAHAVGEGDLATTREVALRLLRTAIWAAALAGACYVAINGDFVARWVGPGYAGSGLLVLAFGLSTVWSAAECVVTATSFAAGRIRASSALSITGQLLRIALLAAGLRIAASVEAVPLSLLATAGVFTIWAATRLLSRVLALGWRDAAGLMGRTLGEAAAPLTVGLLWSCLGPHVTSWAGLVAAAVCSGSGALLALGLVSPGFREAVTATAGRLRRPAVS